MSDTNTPTRQLLAALRHCPVIGIVRASDAATAAAHVDRIVDLGVQAVEVSLSTPGALEAIRMSLHRHSPGEPRLGRPLVGVGTVMAVDELDAAADAGARFVVAPTTDPAVIAAARRRGLPIIPGAATPTEVRLALTSGAWAVKLFPATLWSVRAFRDLQAVFPDTRFVPTGGVGPDDVDAWLDAGAAAVGVGTALTSGDLDVTHLLRIGKQA